MAKSIKLGSDTFLDPSAVAVVPVAKYTLSDITPILYNATITTTANGTYNLGINIDNYTPLFIHAWSASYPNGLIATFILTSGGAIWGRFTATDGSVIAGVALNVRVGYIRKVSQT